MRMLKWGFVFLLMVLLGLVAAGTYYAFTPLSIPEAAQNHEILPGASLATAARSLHKSGALPDSWRFVLLGRLMQRSQNIKAGNYQLPATLSPFELLNKLTEGDFTQSAVTVVEGWTFRQFRDALNKHPDLKHDTAALSEAALLQALGVDAPLAEGWFFPDTYFFAKGSSDLMVLQRAHGLMKKHLEAAWSKRPATAPFKNPYEALILASIVEKETGREAERPLVAAVFVNRMRLGMKLQTDPTVIYGMGERFDGNIRKQDLLTDTPYNTYTRVGLPPTPIALPGKRSLQAVLHPAESDALYFVARGDGTSQFSVSLQEHNRAVDQYQRKRKGN